MNNHRYERSSAMASKLIAKLWTPSDWKKTLMTFPELGFVMLYLGQRHGDTNAYKECIRYVSGGILAPGQKRLTSKRAEDAFHQLEYSDLEGKSLSDMSNSDMEDIRKQARAKAACGDPITAADGERVLRLIGRDAEDPAQLILEHGTPVRDIRKRITTELTKLPSVETPASVTNYTIPAFQSVPTHPLYNAAKVTALALSVAMLSDNHNYAVTCLRYPFNDFKKDTKLELHAKKVLSFTTCQQYLTFKQEFTKMMTKLDTHLSVLCDCLSQAAPTWVQQGEHKSLRPADRGSFHEEYKNTQIGLGNKQM